MSRIFKLLHEVDHGYDQRLRGYQGVIVDSYSNTSRSEELNIYAQVAFSEIEERVDRIGISSFDPFNSRNANWRVSGIMHFEYALWAQGKLEQYGMRNWFNVVLLPSYKACIQFAEAMEPHLTLHLLKSNKRNPGWTETMTLDAGKMWSLGTI